MGYETALRELYEVMGILRGPEGCPWDREQTHDSVIPHLIEEACEAQEAVAEKDWEGFKEELGDVLCQVLFHALIAEADGRFTLTEICDGLRAKLVRRHPHVFKDTKVSGTEEVLKNWELIKREEKKEKGKDGSVLSGVPRSLPALMRAYRIGQKASRVGFEFPDLQEAIKKIEEELAELKEAAGPVSGETSRQRIGPQGSDRPGGTPEPPATSKIVHELGIGATGGTSQPLGTAEHKARLTRGWVSDRTRRPNAEISHELGDLLFSIVNVARHLKINPEMALQETSSRFQKRFQYIEKNLAAQGKSLEESNLADLDQLWEEAKNQ